MDVRSPALQLHRWGSAMHYLRELIARHEIPADADLRLQFARDAALVAGRAGLFDQETTLESGPCEGGCYSRLKRPISAWLTLDLTLITVDGKVGLGYGFNRSWQLAQITPETDESYCHYRKLPRLSSRRLPRGDAIAFLATEINAQLRLAGPLDPPLHTKLAS